MTDPVSWLQIAQGWNVVASDGVTIGTVAQVEGDKRTTSSTAWPSSDATGTASVSAG